MVTAHTGRSGRPGPARPSDVRTRWRYRLSGDRRERDSPVPAHRRAAARPRQPHRVPVGDHGRGRRHASGGPGVPDRRTRRADRVGQGGRPGHPAPAAPVAPGAVAGHHRRPGGQPERPVRGHGPAAQRVRVGRWRAADVPGHRHRDRDGQAHRVGAHRRHRRGRHLGRHLRGVPAAEPALLADGAVDVLGRTQHRHEPAGAGGDLPLPRRRPALRVPVHGQGRRQRQQDVPVPGDEGAAEPDAAGQVPGREAARRWARPRARPTTWRSSSAACRRSTT